jgi:DNA-directed RNA polymerase specialized sigma24 family protein
MIRLLHRKSGLISKIRSRQNANTEGYSGEFSSPEPSLLLKQLKRLKPADVANAIVDYLGGESVHTVADRLGVSRQTVSKILTDHQVERRRGALDANQIAELVTAREQGVAMQDIAEQLGVSLSTVKRRARELRP